MHDENAKKAITDFYDIIASEYGRQYDPAAFPTLDKYPQNYYRLQILINRLANAKVRSVYEVGTGEGTPLAMMARMGFHVAGCDISREMVAATRARLKSAGVENPDVQWGDVEDCLTFTNQIIQPFDVAVAFGVLPHVDDPAVMLRNLRAIVGGKGRVFVEFRNKLFALTTFNRYTYDFIVNDLLAPVAEDVKAVTAETIAARVDMDLPRSDAGPSSYSSIRACFHNPFELMELFERSGFSKPTIHWYHYHPGLPRHQAALGPRWHEEAAKLEHETSGWRGFFLCSAGVIEACAE